jgi:hypothetical protein
MNVAMGGTVFLFLALAGQAGGSGVEVSTAVVPDGSNEALTLSNFIRIRGYILSQGKRETYCAMYNQNPYWAFKGFNTYLNPPDQSNINCVIGKSEFNTLVIQARDPNGAFNYWNVLLDVPGKALRVKQYGCKREPKVLILEASGFFREALAEITRHDPTAGK